MRTRLSADDMLSGVKVLVIGATGTIGSAVVVRPGALRTRRGSGPARRRAGRRA
jgi:FlaA1/EpsC-like NDP-sugar epimerase